MDTIQSILSKQINLPSPPIVIQKLQSVMSHGDVGNHELAQIIETDQAFTARILRLVNSPFYGFVGKIVSVDEAITMLGLNTIHQLLLTTSLLSIIKVDINTFDLNKFWLHSFGVGVLTRHLLFKHSKDAQSEGFIGGILHDIGRIILVKYDSSKFSKFYSQTSTAINLDKEEEFFGINHQKLGEVLAQKWNFPESIQTAIAKHHSPLLAKKHNLLASAVNIADFLCHALQIGDSGNYFITDFYQNAWELMNITMDDLDGILRNSLTEIDNSRQMLGEFST